MTALEVALTGVPGAYMIRPKDLGPKQREWMRRKGWLDRRTVQRLEPAPAHAREVA